MVPVVNQNFGFRPQLFPKVHGWSLWFALRNVFSPQLFPKVHRWSLWFGLCNEFSH
ncbi:hypothetical protein Hanom_Chr15g01354821 [Helianthus anomalus]